MCSPGNYDTESDPLYQEVVSRSAALGRAWASEIAERYQVGCFTPQEAEAMPPSGCVLR